MPAIRKEKIVAGTMSATVDGGYIEQEYNGFAWACSDCGRVWDRRWHAEACARHGHADRFTQTYYSGGAVVNGVYTGRITKFVRQCLRREKEAA